MWFESITSLVELQNLKSTHAVPTVIYPNSVPAVGCGLNA